jgi:transcription initiation factor TFIIH subunit 3
MIKSDDDSDPSILTIIVDTNPLAWKLRGQFGSDNMIDVNEFISQLILFCHCYALLHRSNRIVVIANHPSESTVVYPRRGEDEGLKRDDLIPTCHNLQSVLSKGLLEAVQGIESTLLNPSSSDDGNRRVTDSSDKGSSLAQSLSVALCVTNRQLLLHPKLQPRILVVQLTKDQSTTYNSVMNSIFSAQKLGVVLDAVVLSKEDSRFLQQACLLTRGVYQRPSDQKDLLQLMMAHNLPSTWTRGILHAPMQKLVDFRASCFCHRKPVEFAWMCSVCLALTCEAPEDACSTCGTVARKAIVR